MKWNEEFRNNYLCLKAASLHLDFSREIIEKCLKKREMKAFETEIEDMLDMWGETITVFHWLPEFVNITNVLNDIVLSNEPDLSHVQMSVTGQLNLLNSSLL